MHNLDRDWIGDTCDRDVVLAPGEVVWVEIRVDIVEGLEPANYPFVAVFGAVGDTEEPVAPPARIDLGVALSYEVDFDENYDFSGLAADGFRRVNLYHTWREFEHAFDDPNDPMGTTMEELGAVINKIQAAGLRLSLIIEVADTDCDDAAPESCWTSYGMEDKFSKPSFVGFDDAGLVSDLEDFLASIIARYPSSLVTHIFIGNETDRFLGLHTQYQEGFNTLMGRLKAKVSPLPNRAKFGTIFTFTPDSLSLNYNDRARTLVVSPDDFAG